MVLNPLRVHKEAHADTLCSYLAVQAIHRSHLVSIPTSICYPRPQSFVSYIHNLLTLQSPLLPINKHQRKLPKKLKCDQLDQSSNPETGPIYDTSFHNPPKLSYPMNPLFNRATLIDGLRRRIKDSTTDAAPRIRLYSRAPQVPSPPLPNLFPLTQSCTASLTA